MSSNYFSAIARDSSLNEAYPGIGWQGGTTSSLANKGINLSSLLQSSNLLEEDGIEDLHFYFVSF